MNDKEQEEIGLFGLTVVGVIFLFVAIGAGYTIASFGETTTALNHPEGKVIKIKKSWWGLKKVSSTFIYRQGKWKEVNEMGDEIDVPTPDIKIH